MRTWDENKSAINQLWPTHSWTEEERRLLVDDLGGLDQPTLYDAIRNTKRKHDTPFVHLKWFLDEYRELASAKKHALRASMPKDEKLKLNIDDQRDRKLSEDFVSEIDVSYPADFKDIEKKVLDALPQMHSVSASRVLTYARSRLLGQNAQLSQVNPDGSLKPISYMKEMTP